LSATLVASEHSSHSTHRKPVQAAPLAASDVRGVTNKLSRAESVVPRERYVYATDNELGVVKYDRHTGKVENTCVFASAGYKVNTLQSNGIFVDEDEQYVYLADLYEGFVFRCNLESGLVKVLFQHTSGINDLVQDSTGRLWFTVSALNSAGGAVYGSLGKPDNTGSLWTYDPVSGYRTKIWGNLWFANGVAINEATGTIFVSETTANRVTRFAVDFAAGNVTSGPYTHAYVAVPDGIHVTPRGNLAIASVGTNRVFAASQSNAGTTWLLYDDGTTSYERGVENVVAGQGNLLAFIESQVEFGSAISTASIDESGHLWIAGLFNLLRVSINRVE